MALVAFVSQAMAQAPKATPKAAAPVKILALGTSLTQGYGLPPGTEIPVQLQAALKANEPKQAEPVLTWMKATGYTDPVLKALATELQTRLGTSR